ncbi:MAG: thioredoxin family protein [Microcystis sp.]|uniref:thioredoxin family protein n=1 Tax=Microcystis sp. TaxID=1127 RepID=UPI003919AA81|nr:thioredoxin family protein [Microcystis aeruginosa LG13-13]NCR06618.1 thioredoxin family protein [Microcystis aeruginosa LG13-03]NCR64825.1 thioredoxin family protein [Microcystis aeruginosa LG11-05]
MMLSVNEESFPKLVLESSRPVFVYFWAPWCGLCRLIQPTLLSWQNDCQGAIQLVGVNADNNFKLANSFRLRSLPTLILFDQGVPVHRLEEIHSREELQQTLRLIVKNQILRSA